MPPNLNNTLYANLLRQEEARSQQIAGMGIQSLEEKDALNRANQQKSLDSLSGMANTRVDWMERQKKHAAEEGRVAGATGRPIPTYNEEVLNVYAQQGYSLGENEKAKVDFERERILKQQQDLHDYRTENLRLQDKGIELRKSLLTDKKNQAKKKAGEKADDLKRRELFRVAGNFIRDKKAALDKESRRQIPVMDENDREVLDYDNKPKMRPAMSADKYAIAIQGLREEENLIRQKIYSGEIYDISQLYAPKPKSEASEHYETEQGVSPLLNPSETGDGGFTKSYSGVGGEWEIPYTGGGASGGWGKEEALQSLDPQFLQSLPPEAQEEVLASFEEQEPEGLTTWETLFPEEAATMPPPTVEEAAQSRSFGGPLLGGDESEESLLANPGIRAYQEKYDQIISDKPREGLSDTKSRLRREMAVRRGQEELASPATSFRSSPPADFSRIEKQFSDAQRSMDERNKEESMRDAMSRRLQAKMSPTSPSSPLTGLSGMETSLEGMSAAELERRVDLAMMENDTQSVLNILQFIREDGALDPIIKSELISRLEQKLAIAQR